MTQVETNWPHPAYRIETRRLLLRCYAPDDAEELTRSILASRDHLAPWMPWAAEPKDLDFNRELLRAFRGRFDLGLDFTYGIYDPQSGEQIGGAGLHTRLGPHALEIGYWIAAHRVREGLATEASAALTRVGLEVMNAKRIEIRCEPGNEASAGVPAKLGYTYVGIMPWSLAQADGSMRDTKLFAITAEQYPSTPAADLDLRAYGVAGQQLL